MPENKSNIAYKGTVKISACVITKDEANNLSRWLHSMSQIADEMIVVDTGSTDSTKKIAQTAGAKVYDFQWINDFAAAKNYALSKAIGDWIIFCDADEYFTDKMAPKLYKEILETNTDKKIDAFICRLINIDVDYNNRIIDSFYQLRVFRHIPAIRYHGSIHESLMNNDDSLNLKLLPRDIYIYHTGYSSKIIEKKLKRNLKMIQDDIVVNGMQDKYYKPLADCYYGLGNYEKAIEYNQKIIDTGMTLVGMDIDVYLQYIHALWILDKPKEKIKNIINKGLSKYATSSDLNYQKGFLLFDNQDYVQAEKYLQRALQYYVEYEQISATNMYNELFLVYGLLGNIYLLKNEREEAIKYYIRSLQEKPYYTKFFNNLFFLIKTINIKVKIKLLNKIYSEKDKDFLLNTLKYMGEYTLYMHYKNIYEADKTTFLDAECFVLINGKYQLDIKKITKTLDIIYKKIIVNVLKANTELDTQATVILPQNYQIAFCHTKDKFSKKKSSVEMRNNSKVSKVLLDEAVVNIKYLCLALALLPNLDRDNLKFLSHPILRIILRFFGEINHFEATDFVAYTVMLPVFIKCAPDDVLKKYVLLSTDLTLSMQKEVITAVVNKYRWDMAYILLNTIKQNKFDAYLFYEYARCLYYHHELKSAAKYFKKAKDAGMDKKAIDSYCIWIKDRKNSKL